MIELLWYYATTRKILVAKIKTKTQSEINAKLLDSKLLDAFLNSVNPFIISQKEGSVTAVVANVRRHKIYETHTNRDTITLTGHIPAAWLF